MSDGSTPTRRESIADVLSTRFQQMLRGVMEQMSEEMERVFAESVFKQKLEEMDRAFEEKVFKKKLEEVERVFEEKESEIIDRALGAIEVKTIRMEAGMKALEQRMEERVRWLEEQLETVMFHTNIKQARMVKTISELEERVLTKIENHEEIFNIMTRSLVQAVGNTIERIEKDAQKRIESAEERIQKQGDNTSLEQKRKDVTTGTEERKGVTNKAEEGKGVTNKTEEWKGVTNKTEGRKDVTNKTEGRKDATNKTEEPKETLTTLATNDKQLGRSPSPDAAAASSTATRGCRGEYLLLAAQEGRAEDVRVLLDEGVDVNFRSEFSDTALHNAAKYLHEDVVELLVQRGADVNAWDCEGYNPLHWAADTRSKDSARCISILIEGGASVNSLTEDDETPLHLAANCENEGAMWTLTVAGADTTATDSEGRTPFDRLRRPHALLCGYSDVERFLKKMRDQPGT